MTDNETLEDLLVAWEEATDAGNPVTVRDLCWARPDLEPELQRRINALEDVAWVAQMGRRVGLVTGSEPVKGFRLVAPLGRGGSGEVWKSIGPGGFEVALKFIPRAEKAARDELRALDALRRVRHPHLLALVGAWDAGDWLVLGSEVADESLFDRCGKLTLDDTLDHFLGAAVALDHLHQAGILHRDVKPQNMLLQDGILKVADFGLTRATAHTETGHTGAMTFAYAAPEFFDGKSHRNSDQYALAISYCQVRGGRVPFEGSPAQVMRGHLDKRPDLTMLPSVERAPVERALAKDPAERWPGCIAFMEALYMALDLLPPALKQESTSRRSLKVETLMERGIYLAYEDHLDEAQATFELAVRLDPDERVARLAQSITCLRVRDLACARKICEDTAGFDAQRALIRFYIGQRTSNAAVGDRGILDFQAAKAMLSELRSQPSDSEGIYSLDAGIDFFAEDDDDEADDDLGYRNLMSMADDYIEAESARMMDFD